MKVASLQPAVEERVEFLWSQHRLVPNEPGCYVIATFDLTVLYVGLATKSIQSRMASHLDSNSKRKGSAGKPPYWFYFLKINSNSVHVVERGWMNESILRDGARPPLNLVDSPVS